MQISVPVQLLRHIRCDCDNTMNSIIKISKTYSFQMCITCSMIKIGQFSGQSVDDPDDWLFTQIIRQAPTMSHFSDFIEDN